MDRTESAGSNANMGVSFPLLLNKLPQTQWFITTQIYYLAVMEVRSPKFNSLD